MSPRNRLYFRVGKFKWNNLSLYGLSFSLIMRRHSTASRGRNSKDPKTKTCGTPRHG